MRDPQPMPPRIFLRFFRWFCHPELKPYIEGDLSELYHERVARIGKRNANLKFIIDVILLLRPGIIRPLTGTRGLNNPYMIKSYLKIGSRNLLKNKAYSIINIGGLALGMAVAIVIGLWVHDELSFNKYFANYDRIAQVMKAGTYEGKFYQGRKYIQYPLIEELKTSYGENFKHVVPISGPGGWEGVLSAGERKVTKTGLYIGEGAPEMFTWKMIAGSWSGLNDPHSIMVSSSTARALFANADPMGKALKINGTTEVTVTGVFEDFPRNTEFYGIDFFEPWKFYLMDAPWIKEQGWQNHFLWLYVEIMPNTSFARVQDQIKDAEVKVIRNLDYMQEHLKYNPEIRLHPMRDWHLYGTFNQGELRSGPAQFVWFIGAIGVFVLLLACINFMNLSTARSEKRAKEVGIRKTIGSVRRQLVGQFLCESFLVVVLAFLAASVLVAFTLPWFNELAAKDMQLPLAEPWFWYCCGGFVLITGLLAGSYPAFYLSSFNPVSVLKGRMRLKRIAVIPRKVLVVVQFTVSVVLTVCTVAIYSQIMYVKDRPVGYEREGLIMMRKKSDAFNTKGDALRAELRNSGAVVRIAESGGEVTGVWSNNGGFSWEGKDPSFDAVFATLNVSPEFGSTVGWEFVAGRDFSPLIASDSAAIVINESAVKYMGLKDPVGKVIRWTNLAWDVDQDFTIVGVIRDMLMDSPFAPVKPTIYLTYGYERVLLLRLNPAMELPAAIGKVESVFTNLIPEIPFDYQFVDEAFADKFSTEERIGKLAAVFAALAIIISCLGLFGLASFVAEQRTKEIGIRKVLGATIGNLWRLLSQEFMLLVSLASVIAIPISYFILDSGLRNYEYKTEVAWWIFAAAALVAIVITLSTVSFQSIKAAMMNPVNSLKSE